MGNCKCNNRCFDSFSELSLFSEDIKQEQNGKDPKFKRTLRSNRTIEEKPYEEEDDTSEQKTSNLRSHKYKGKGEELVKTNSLIDKNTNYENINSNNILNAELKNSDINDEDLFKAAKIESKLEIQSKPFEKTTSFQFGLTDDFQAQKNNDNNNIANDNYVDLDIQNNLLSSRSPQNFQGDLAEFVERALNKHNRYREMHNVPPLKEDKQITRIAQEYAEYLAENNMFQHSENNFRGDTLGENIYFGTQINPETMTTSWYNEIKNYDFDNPTEKNYTKIGHFCQIVWKDTRLVGFGFAKSKEGYYYGVANYYPAGNVMDNFEKNVFPINLMNE